MIRIVSQSAQHQYDDKERAITTWDEKKCAWIVQTEFETEKIDWWGADNDFPGGYTLKEYVETNPNWDKNPDIVVTWYWHTKETCIKAFGLPHTFGQKPDYWDKQLYPYSATRQWGYIDEKKDNAVNNFGKYARFHEHADRVVVTYNGETLHDGVLK